VTVGPRRWRAIVYTSALLVTPVLHGLAFPPARLHLLAWIAFVPWFVAIRLATPGVAALVSAVTTLVGTYLVSGWLPRAVAVYYAQPAALGIALFLGAWTVTLAPGFLAFTAAYRAMARRFAGTLPLLAAAAWVAVEFGRVRIAGNPFGLLGYSQAGVMPVLQIADVTGVYGLAFAVVTVNAALAELVLGLLREGRVTAAARTGLALAGVVLGAVLAYGLHGLRAEAREGAAVVPVAIAQANLDLGSQWRPELYGRNLEEYMRLTLDATRRDSPALVVWPESAMTFFLEDEPTYRTALASVLAPAGVQLLAGGPRAVQAPVPRYYNSVFLVSPRGEILGRYDKERLLPFAEYFPFASVALLRREFARVREFTPGGPTAPLPTVAGAAGVVICNEALFPEIVARRVRAGARLLVNLSNDSWLLDPQFSAQALDTTRVRAVEQRRYLVRASTSGPSAIIDPAGRILAETAPFSRATIGGAVQPRVRLTVYGRLGDVFAGTCTLVAIGATLAGLRRERSPRAASPARRREGRAVAPTAG
jgi:apolipoprotein N-acyltransferase